MSDCVVTLAVLLVILKNHIARFIHIFSGAASHWPVIRNANLDPYIISWLNPSLDIKIATSKNTESG